MKLTKEQVLNFHHPDIDGVPTIFGVETTEDKKVLDIMIEELEKEKPGFKMEATQSKLKRYKDVQAYLKNFRKERNA